MIQFTEWLKMRDMQEAYDKQGEWYWGPVFDVAREGNEILFTIKDGRVLRAKSGSVTKMKAVPPPGMGPSPAHPWNKFFRFREENGQYIVSELENRSADICPIDPSTQQYFLIRRRDNGKLAVPGGMIDESEVRGPKDADWRTTAEREFEEETGISLSQCLEFTQLLGQPMKCDDPRDHAVTVPFVAILRPGVRGFGGDDAMPEEMAGFDYATVPPLAFNHHKEVIRLGIAYAKAHYPNK